MKDKVAILGSTGSVGVSTLDVIRAHGDRYEVTALAANTNVDLMLAQCNEFEPEIVVMMDAQAAIKLRAALIAQGLQVEVISGNQALDQVASAVDTVVCAIVGAAGLPSTIAAVRAGASVLVANKEPLVMLGHHIMDLAKQHNAIVLPLDSEHNAIFQCLPMAWQKQLGHPHAKTEYGIRRLLLTGSGGPFRTLDKAQFPHITPDQACAHPKWKMGRKISVDSATMMNKGLELIEACSLFNMDEADIDIVIHPESVVHSMVEYVDGSVLAQMANPDMKTPIANALAWPDRIESGVKGLNLVECAQLNFESPDNDRFPALKIAREVARQGGTAPAILNAANEIAVDAFLGQQIGFNQIIELVEQTMTQVTASSKINLETAIQSDQQSRAVCAALIKK